MMKELMEKINRDTVDDGAFDDIMFWVECPEYQDEVHDIKIEMTTDSNGGLVKHMTFCFDGISNTEDTSIDAFVLDNCIEWSNLIMDLSNKEKKFYRLKNEYKSKSDKLLEEARKLKEETEEDIIKKRYGGNNDKTRAKYVKESLAEENKQLKELEFDIEYLKRRLPYLKGLVAAKTAILNAKTEGVEL